MFRLTGLGIAAEYFLSLTAVSARSSKICFGTLS